MSIFQLFGPSKREVVNINYIDSDPYGCTLFSRALPKSLSTCFYFQVDIGTSEPATLSYLAFEGATKKNKPSINNGDVVYAKIVTASKDMEPELVCVDAYGNKAGLGQLTGTVTNMTLKVTSMILIFQSSYK